jgi:formylglycine-generating enzyme required for sulfatase activity
LPTEAQWEWACRAGSGFRYSWGPDEDTTGKLLNVGDRALQRVPPDWPRALMAMDDGHAFPAPVGSYRPNGFGLHDMLGNVWEFCSTHYGPYPKGPVTDPVATHPISATATWGSASRCAFRARRPRSTSEAGARHTGRARVKDAAPREPSWTQRKCARYG